MNYEYEEAPCLEELAVKLIARFPSLEHIDVEEVLFLREKVATPAAFAECHRLSEHPIGFFTPKKFCIVFYEANIEHFTPEQRTMLLFHELKHIGRKNRLKDHNVKDFRSILGINLDWHKDGADVPDILGDDYVETYI